MTEKVIHEVRFVETDDGFRIEVKGDKERIKQMGFGPGMLGFGSRMMGFGPGRRFRMHRRHAHSHHKHHFHHFSPWGYWGEEESDVEEEPSEKPPKTA